MHWSMFLIGGWFGAAAFVVAFFRGAALADSTFEDARLLALDLSTVEPRHTGVAPVMPTAQLRPAAEAVAPGPRAA